MYVLPIHERFVTADAVGTEEDVDGCGSVTRLPPRNTTSNSRFVLAIDETNNNILLVFF